MKRTAWAAAAACVLWAAATTARGQEPGPPQEPAEAGFRFRTGVELVNVNATVTDSSGRFVPGLRVDDFVVHEDNVPQTITHFSAERTPVSLGIVLDMSDSMEGEKIEAARGALNRLLFDLLAPDDEIFLYQFNDHPVLVQGWTSDRRRLSRALDRVNPDGATAMYDAVAEAVPLAKTGRHQKKAILLISDGNDTSSRTPIIDLKQLMRESEVLLYAIGIDGEDSPQLRRAPRRPPSLPIPFPFPPGRRPFPQIVGQNWPRGVSGNRVNVTALRDLTDDTGGRTEIVRSARDLNPSTASIASELSQQYYLGYPSTGKKDGRWHAIRVEVRNPAYRVRARRGYIAS
jgi:Ca-activated chloride channel family protein